VVQAVRAVLRLIAASISLLFLALGLLLCVLGIGVLIRGGVFLDSTDSGDAALVLLLAGCLLGMPSFFALRTLWRRRRARRAAEAT
jgi:pilus assembly protein TadC